MWLTKKINIYQTGMADESLVHPWVYIDDA
jgi:hypothetical protein